MIKVILPAGDIPLGSIVTKRTGEKQYLIKDRIRIFNAAAATQEIKATDGARFLVGDNGDFNVVSSQSELVWQAEEYDLQRLLEGPDQ